MNTARYGVNLSGNINIRTTETINLSVGGTFNKTEGDAFSYSGSFFNYDKTPALIIIPGVFLAVSHSVFPQITKAVR